MESVEIRKQLVDALQLDLIGPDPASDLEEEILPQPPSRWYLTGFLVPLEAEEEQRSEETAGEEVDELDDAGGSDDTDTPEPRAAKRAFYPSSIGLSFLVSENMESIQIVIRWGDYIRKEWKETSPEQTEDTVQEREEPLPTSTWHRSQHRADIFVVLPTRTTQPVEIDIPDSNGLKLAVATRPISPSMSSSGLLPDGARLVSVFLVNWRKPEADELRDQAFIFQAQLEVRTEESLIPRPTMRGIETNDWDEQVGDLQYRNAVECAVGHGVATDAELDAQGECRRIWTCWIPQAEVERIAPGQVEGVEFSIEALATLSNGTEARERLDGLTRLYRAWIESQRQQIPQEPSRRIEIADELLKRAEIAARRIDEGIDLLNDPVALEAFQIAHRAIGAAARQRFGVIQGIDPNTVEPPTWRPFQLAYLLMNLSGIVNPTHPDREVVDLLFFPTGGGKTEAYLGLSAFTLVYRRLKNPGITSAGVSVIMRYTLRLLTLDQLSRAATLICALELERQKDTERLGEWPFEIGLWVGRAATPNRMGKKGDGDSYSARAKTIAFKNDDRKPSPIPLEECPWCGTKFKATSFQLLPNPDNPTDLRVGCVNRTCDFTRNRPLPILGVDEPIYRRLPCFLIATVDKFAAMPWTGEVGGFFGRVDHYDEHGFYGPCHPNIGQALENPLPPPELIVQDELHLISGPMGTMVGLYESALDELSAYEHGGKKIRAKIIASTATVRRAEHQIQALFDRRNVDVFPPPGPDVRDSFFARTHSPEESSARLYLGIAAQGRSLKVVLLRAYLALLGAAQKAYLAEGGLRNQQNPADPYMTLLGYFNSLRELGGSRRIIEDEVGTRLTSYGRRKREGDQEGVFENRKIAYDVVELTSRVSTDKVADAKRRLTQPFHEKDHVDVAIATNMISVGLDITRLGLMVVLGQPKMSAEYIQATSRVGRDETRPGLVVTLLNIHRPRDRSHYERFKSYHESFYRSVEATSVTPFAPRALDRGLAGTAVALARQGFSPLTPPLGAEAILNERDKLDYVVTALTERAYRQPHDLPEDAALSRQGVRDQTLDLLDEWYGIAKDYNDKGIRLQYQREVGAAQRLLYEFLHPELNRLPQRHQKFRANRSMRDVEPDVNLWLRTLDNLAVEDEES